MPRPLRSPPLRPLRRSIAIVFFITTLLAASACAPAAEAFLNAAAPSSSSPPRCRPRSDAGAGAGAGTRTRTTTGTSNRSTSGTSLSESGRATLFGPPQVDLNTYNLPIEEIAAQWSARLVPQTADTEEGVYLFPRNDRELFVDTIEVSYPRLGDTPGLGLELTELAGGRGDGVGITVVSGLVEDGAAVRGEADVMVGDSISSVSVVRRRRQRQRGVENSLLSEAEDVMAVRTECLGYDATVETLSSLPPPVNSEDEEDTYLLEIKRLRRKPRVTVNLQYPPSQNEPDASIEMFAGENLRLGMLVRGVKLNDPLAKRFDTKTGGNCGAGGLCRTCAVTVTRGMDLLNPQKVNEKQMLEDSGPRWRLACKAFVGYGMKEGEITIRVNPNQW